MVNRITKARIERLALLPVGRRPRRFFAGMLGSVGLVALVTAGWPLQLGDSARLDPAATATENVSWRTEDDGWRSRSLRAPLGSGGSFDVVEYEAEYVDEESEVVLVGVSYRSAGVSLAFLRFGDGAVRVLGVGEEHEGLRMMSVERDHVVVARDGASSRLELLVEAGPGTDAPPVSEGRL